MSLHRELLTLRGRWTGSNASAVDPWQFKGKAVPWRRIRDWRCIACGECCRHFSVPITQEEWRTIVDLYGLGFTTVINGKPHIRSSVSGGCIFQRRSQGMWLCAIQSVKPLVCKLWPFRIYGHPRHGDPDSASFTYRRQEMFVYCDPRCSGVFLGPPSPHLAESVIPEFAAMALGEKVRQRSSTAQTHASDGIPLVGSPYRPGGASMLVLDALIRRNVSDYSLQKPYQRRGPQPQTTFKALSGL